MRFAPRVEILTWVTIGLKLAQSGRGTKTPAGETSQKGLDRRGFWVDADLSVTKTDRLASINAGSSVTYSIAVVS